MKFIIKIYKNFTRENKILLGRWNLISCHNKINKIIDLSNIDNCGPCGIDHLQSYDKITHNIKNNITNKINNYNLK